jgi:hypothetical protein
MELFHVSFREYVVGQTYYASNPINYHLRCVVRGEGWVNETLDKYRPAGMPSRISSFYACDNFDNCQSQIDNERIENKNPIFYKVEMDCPKGFPLALAHRLKYIGQKTTTWLETLYDNAPELLENDFIEDIQRVNKAKKCIDEYWSPTHRWKNLEFLSPTMKIVDILPNPGRLTGVGSNNYCFDSDLAKSLYS